MKYVLLTDDLYGMITYNLQQTYGVKSSLSGCNMDFIAGTFGQSCKNNLGQTASIVLLIVLLLA